MPLKAIITLVCAGLIIFLSMGTRQSMGLFLAPMSSDLGFGREVFALALAIQNLMSGLMQPITGAIADKFGAKRVAFIGGTLYVIGLLITAFADSALDLYAGTGFIIGLAGTGTTFAVVLGAIGRLVPKEKRSLALGMGSAAASMGQLVIAPISQGLISDFGWSMSLVILAVMVGAIVPLAAALTGKPDETSFPDEVEQTLKQALCEAGAHSGYRLLTVAYFVCGFQIAFIAVHFPAFLNDQGLPPGLAGTAIGLIGLFNIFGTIGFGWLGGRYSKKLLLSGIYFARSVTFIIFLRAPITETSVLIFASDIGILWLSTVPLTGGLIAQVFGVRYMATLFGITFLSHQIGSFMGAWLGGFLFDSTGSYDLMWTFIIATGLIATIMHLPIRDKPIQRAAPTEAKK